MASINSTGASLLISHGITNRGARDKLDIEEVLILSTSVSLCFRLKGVNPAEVFEC